MKRKIIVISLTILVLIAIIIYINCFRKEKTNVSQNTNDIENENIEEENNYDIFADYYEIAQNKLETLTLDEKIGQIFLVRYPDTNAVEQLQKYKFGGYLFFEKDFKDKTEEQIKSEIENLQMQTSIPLLIAVDEEGGDVVRVSSNKNLAEEKFKSLRELYEIGGFDKIREDTIEKSNFLYNLGINLNLAPVVDVTTNPNDYMYKRSLGQETELTSILARTVITASKESKVSYTLKHFPGYGNNVDTHKGSSRDDRTYEELFTKDLPPFIVGIEAGAEAILVSHNIVTSIDGDNPASLSLKVHELLKDELGFKGVIITDDLYMGAVSEDKEAVIKAIIARNDLIIVTEYEKAIEDVKNAISDGRINEEMIEKQALQVLAWKYYKKMM